MQPEDDVPDINVRMWHAQRGMHACCLAAVAAFHAYEASLNPATAHTVVATIFVTALVRRLVLHTGRPDPQARLDFARDCSLLAILCPCCALAAGLTIPLTAGVFAALLCGYALVNFSLLMTGFPWRPKVLLLLGHALMTITVEPDAALITRSGATISLLVAMACGSGFALTLDRLLRSVNPLPSSPPPSSASSSVPELGMDRNAIGVGAEAPPPQSAQERRAHLFEMVELLREGRAQLIDVRETHETCHGVLHDAVVFPLSRMTDGSMALPPGLDKDRRTYIYCARGVRVYPAADELCRMGFGADRLVPLNEGYETLLAFGKELNAPQLSADSLHTPSLATPPESASDSSSDRSFPDKASSGDGKPGISELLDKGFVGGRVSDLSDYDTVQTLGYGTFAHVLLLKHRVSGELVVSKQMGVAGLTLREQKRLATEVAVQASLRHQYVIQLRGFHEANGQLSMLMQYAPCGSVDAHLQSLRCKGRQIDISTFLRPWLSQIATGLLYVHSCSVLHRDISSQNIFLDSFGNALIGDFGLSHSLLGSSMASFASMGGTAPTGDGKSAPKTQCGTPTYMSPELISGAPYGAPSDVWAFGVLLVEMMTLQLPFYAPSLGGVVSAILAGRWLPKTREAFEASEASAELKALVSHEALLHPEPTKRMTLREVLHRFPLQADG